jgi:hypothetical protein
MLFCILLMQKLICILQVKSNEYWCIAVVSGGKKSCRENYESFIWMDEFTIT